MAVDLKALERELRACVADDDVMTNPRRAVFTLAALMAATMAAEREMLGKIIPPKTPAGSPTLTLAERAARMRRMADELERREAAK